MKKSKLLLIVCFFMFVMISHSMVISKQHQAKLERNLNESKEEMPTWLKVVCVAILIYFLFHSWSRRRRKLILQEPKKKVNKRILYRRFQRALHKVRGTKLKRISKLSDLKKAVNENKIFKMVQDMASKLGGEKISKKLFKKEYPRIIRFIESKTNGGTQLKLSDAFTLANEYGKQYYGMEMSQNKGMMMSNLINATGLMSNLSSFLG